MKIKTPGRKAAKPSHRVQLRMRVQQTLPTLNARVEPPTCEEVEAIQAK
jgi:hypothetical protein